MKKYIYFTAITLSLILLITGCSWFSNDAEDDANVNENENQNTNQVAAVDQNNNINQTMIEDENVNTDQEIDTNENVNQETEINENINETADQNINVNINEAEDLSDEVSIEVDTSDWLTYENEVYGFSLRYPEDWLVMSEYDYENKKPILDDNATRFIVEHKDIAWKKQSAPNLVGIGVNITNIKERMEEFESVSDSIEQDTMNGLPIYIYNQSEIIYYKSIVIPKKQMIISMPVDEKYNMLSPYKEIYNSIKF